MKMVSQKIILRFFTPFLFFLPQSSKGIVRNDSDLVVTINKAINYLAAQQVKKNDSSAYEGEWPSYISNLNKIPYLGKKGKSAYDSNVFNTLFIHNTLAELYLSNLKQDKIIPILQRAQKNFSYYKNDGSFNFWPDLPKQCKHKSCRQRGPVKFKYSYGFIRNYANVFDDADDSSSGLLAYFYRDSIESGTHKNEFSKEELYKKLALHRDTGSRKTNWYNKRVGFRYRTGAYMTWFGPDRKHSGFFSWFFPYHKKQNILYGRNEIDCVVNANILRMMYVTGDTLIRGITDAKKFLRASILKDKCFTCGVYYPTEFTFHYAMAKAIASGMTGFDDIKAKLTEQIIRGKGANGFWSSQMENNDLQATLYAVNALMLLEGKDALPHLEGILDYLSAYMISEEDQAHWPGGIFFSGGTAIRYSHVWRSDAYTTCLALEALMNYSRLKNTL